MTEVAQPRRRGLCFVLAAALLYCIWLGGHWLPLPYSDKELAAFVSRLWDVQTEFAAGHGLTWWTPFYMNGSSYGLNHSQGLYLLPCLLLAKFVSLPAAVKLTSLLAIFAGGWAMYGCARYFIKNEWAAAFAGIVFLLHPEQIIRAAGAEHLGVILFLPFMPLTFWLMAKALDTGRFRNLFCCALALTGMLWAHNKMAFIHGLFLVGYLGYRFGTDRQHWQLTIKRLGVAALLTGVLAGPFIVPGLLEAGQVKLLSGEGEQLVLWQRNYSFKSLFGLVDRDGVVTHATTDKLQQLLQAQAFHPTTQAEANEMSASVQRLFSLQADSPEKYMGLVLLAVLAVTTLFNTRRADRRLYWFLVALLLISLMLAFGLSSIWDASLATWNAFTLAGLPVLSTVAMWLGLGAVVAFLVLFYRRKLTTTSKRWMAWLALAAFLFLPAFKVLALIPFFKEVRAPFVFHDGPGMFVACLLAGFFVTDVLESAKWRAKIPAIVAGVGMLVLLDFWPYQKPTIDNGVPVRTLTNLKATYETLRSDPDWVKTYSISGRYFHLLGPMYSGKPQVYEAFFNWMAPLGTGLLNQRGLSREMLNLFGARYLVYDKTDPQANAQFLSQIRQSFPVQVENEDFVVFRNDTAQPYVSATTRACLYTGDVRGSAPLALTMANWHYTLVHATQARPGYEKIYDGQPPVTLPTAISEKLTLQNVELTRPSHEQIRIKLTAPRACVATINESYFEFWRAEVDGQPAEVLRVNCGLMGVAVEQGTHEIILRYRPPAVYAIAGIVSLLGLLGGLGVLVTTRATKPAGQ